MTAAYQALTNIFTEYYQLKHSQLMLQWDEAVNMPVGGGHSRAQALATLQAVMQKLIANDKVADLLQTAQHKHLSDPWQKTNLKLMQQMHHRLYSVPTKLFTAAIEAQLASEQAWRRCREQNDWKTFLPYQITTFELQYEIAQHRQTTEETLYDVALADYIPGYTQAMIDPIFSSLATTLPDLIKQYTNTPTQPPPKLALSLSDENKLFRQVMKNLGFNFKHGRLDRTFHPFCSGVPTDVRITTNHHGNNTFESLFAVCHETGHGLYEQNLPTQWQYLPVGQALGMAVHESQSLIIENQLCKSDAFLAYLQHILKPFFKGEGSALASSLTHIQRSIKPGLIRVNADEVCYPLHILIRYEIEKLLFSKKIQIKDLPEYWDQAMQQYFNLSTHGNYQDGVMQDVHWPSGTFGYFPAYTLGNLMAAQLFKTFLAQQPNFMEYVTQGDTRSLVNWLRKHIHQHASSLTMDQLLVRSTSESLNPDYFIQYLHERYC